MFALPGVRTFRIAFFAAVVVFTIAALLASPPFAPSFDNADKVQHMVVFALLAGLASFGFPEAPRRLIVERLSFFGALIEVFQSIPVLHRDCDVWDWATDTLAVAITVVLVSRLVPRRRSSAA